MNRWISKHLIFKLVVISTYGNWTSNFNKVLCIYSTKANWTIFRAVINLNTKNRVRDIEGKKTQLPVLFYIKDKGGLLRNSVLR